MLAMAQENATSPAANASASTATDSVAKAPDIHQSALPFSLSAEEVYKPSDDAAKFKFTKVDDELLRQIDAFDKYMEDKGWVYNDPVVNHYIERVGLAVVPPNPPEKVQWRFHILRDPVPNAFALPNGSIYVNSGLLSRLENEAQLAAVLAHESTHVFNRHSYLSYRDMRKKMVAIDILQAAASAAAYGGVNYGIVQAIGNVIPLALITSMFGYRSELEHQSDVYAVQVLKFDGYDPMQMSKALDLLHKGPEVDLSQEALFWSDHPKLATRVKDTAEIAKSFGEAENSGRTEELIFIASTKSAVRHDAGLAMMLGRPRSAVAVALRLVQLDPTSGEDYALLGDAYRALGGRTAIPTDEEQSSHGKGEARKLQRKQTLPEYEKYLLDAPGGSDNWKSNRERAEKAYSRALELDENNARALRGSGFLYEAESEHDVALSYFKKYLSVVPEPKDARQIRMHIVSVEKKIAAANTAEPKNPEGAK
jgi:beta-barrel assembly-enhancing protease